MVFIIHFNFYALTVEAFIRFNGKLMSNKTKKIRVPKHTKPNHK